MRDAANHVGAQLDGLLHQRATVRIGLDALLREGDDLQVDQVAGFLAHFEHGLERGQGRVGDVDVRAHMLDAMVDQHVDGLLGAGLGVFMGDQRLALGPAFDALEQRAAHVPGRLAGCERGIEVDVRLDEGRHDEIAGSVQVAFCNGMHGMLGLDGCDALIVQGDAVQAVAAAQAGIVDDHQVSSQAGDDRRRINSATLMFRRSCGSSNEQPVSASMRCKR